MATEKVNINVHPKNEGLLLIMEQLGYGELTIKVEAGIATRILHGIQGLDPAKVKAGEQKVLKAVN
jgi:hypothetical protein